MKDTIRLFAVASVLAFGGVAPAFADPSPVGTWRDDEKGSVIKVYECGGAMCASVLKPYQPGAKDVYNPEPALRERPITGLVIMNHAKKGDGPNWSGNLYNAEDGKTYSGTLKAVSDNTLQMQGCAMSIFCQTRGFTRVK